MTGTMIVLTPGESRPVVTQLSAPPELDALQKAVGGSIEYVSSFADYLVDGVLHKCVVYCNEEGKLENLPMNETATLAWEAALLRSDNSLFDQRGRVKDVLVGPIVILYGDDEFMEAQ